MKINEKTSIRWPIWQPLVVILVASVLILAFDVDRKFSSFGYDPVGHQWPYYRIEPWASLYRYGTIPAVVVGCLAVVVAAFGHRLGSLKTAFRANEIRRSGLFVTLLLITGPGLLVESGLKSLWGRPRPWQCQEFDGTMDFLPLGVWGTQRIPNSSFPSGHAAAAFFLMGPGFVISPNRSRLRNGWLWGGLGYGCVMGLTRVLQGGHFLSDVMWAGVIVYFVAVGLERLMFPAEPGTPATLTTEA